MFGKKVAYDCTVVRLTGPEWHEYDAVVEKDMFVCYDERGRQVEMWPKDKAVPYHSPAGLVYLFSAAPDAVVTSADLATLEERVPFYALNQPTQESIKSYPVIFSLITIGLLLFMLLSVHAAASDASGAKAAAEAVVQIVGKK